MADIEVPIAYAVAVVLMLSLFLKFFLEWRFRHKYSLTYLYDRLPLPLLYFAFVLSLIFLIEKQRNSLWPSTYTAHLTGLITGSLWVSLGLQIVIALRIWKKIQPSWFFYGLRMVNRQPSYTRIFVRPILLSIVTQVIVVLQALFYIASYCDLPWYTPALFLVSSNLLVYGLPLILTAHILRKYQHGSDATHEAERAALAEEYRRRQRKAWGLMIAAVVTLAVALASVALLVVAALLGGRFRQSLVLWETILGCLSAVSWVLLQAWKKLIVRGIRQHESTILASSSTSRFSV